MAKNEISERRKYLVANNPIIAELEDAIITGAYPSALIRALVDNNLKVAVENLDNISYKALDLIEAVKYLTTFVEGTKIEKLKKRYQPNYR